MIENIVVTDHGEGWTYVRQATLCPVCQGEKPLGKIVCEMCRKTRTFSSMVPALEGAEHSMRWSAERKANRAVPKRLTDPILAPCRNCGGTDLVFVRSETPGKRIDNRVTANVYHYVHCNACRMRTLARPSKKLAAIMWAAGKVGVFIP